MEKKHFGELSNLLTGIKGETIGKPGDQGSVYPPWEGLIYVGCSKIRIPEALPGKESGRVDMPYFSENYSPTPKFPGPLSFISRSQFYFVPPNVILWSFVPLLPHYRILTASLSFIENTVKPPLTEPL